MFDFDRAVKTGADWKDFIAPFYVRHCQNEQGAFDGQTLEMAGAYVRAYYLPQLPNAVDPELIARLMAGSWHAILTLDSVPVPQNVARKRLMDLYLQNGRAIEKQQEARNKAKAWSSDITYERRREREELESYLDILNDNDEKLYYLGVYAILSANSKEQLEHDATAFLSTAEGEGVFLFRGKMGTDRKPSYGASDRDAGDRTDAAGVYAATRGVYSVSCT